MPVRVTTHIDHMCRTLVRIRATTAEADTVSLAVGLVIVLDCVISLVVS